MNNQIARDSNRLLGGYNDSALIIDETGIRKKDKKSVGVARQWCGQLGKVDNQVAALATLVRGSFSLPIDCRLYLPKEWIKDRKRCEKAKIPADQIVFTEDEVLRQLEVRHRKRQASIDAAYRKTTKRRAVASGGMLAKVELYCNC